MIAINNILIPKSKLPIDPKSIRFQVYYPYYFSNWEITYKSLLGKEQKLEKYTAFDAYKGGCSFSDIYPKYVVKEVKKSQAMLPLIPKTDAYSEQYEFTRRYFIHYKKIWRVPTIKLVKEDIIYLPYTVFDSAKDRRNNKKLLLYEHSSEKTGVLKNFPEVKEFVSNL